MDPNQVAMPCGLRAKYYFHDSYAIISPEGNAIEISTESITWPVDLSNKFIAKNPQTQWLDVTSPRFINWFRTSPDSSFTKTFGLIQQSLHPGTYALRIDNRWDQAIHKGEKSFLLLKTNWFGGDNKILGGCYISVGVLSLLLLILSVVRKYQRPNGVLYHKINKIILYSESKLALNN